MERDAIMLLFQFHQLASHELAGDALSQPSRQRFIDNPNLLGDIVPGPAQSGKLAVTLLSSSPMVSSHTQVTAFGSSPERSGKWGGRYPSNGSEGFEVAHTVSIASGSRRAKPKGQELIETGCATTFAVHRG